MGTFIADGSLPAAKEAGQSTPPGATATNALYPSDLNAHRGALLDLRAQTSGWVNLETYAAGDGTTDDTTALSTAIATGKHVKGAAGDTYLVDGGLVSSTAGQSFDFTGCTLKLKNSATTKGILRLAGAGSRVVGGTWDLNVSNNASGDAYGYYAVLLDADRTAAEGLYVKDSHGIGVKADTGVNYAEVRGCRVENCALTGIFFDGSDAADAYGNQIRGNTVDVSAVTGAQGIYIASASPYDYVQRRWVIEGNVIVGSASAGDNAVGITGRGYDGIVTGNHVSGFNIGISVDISGPVRSVISSNRIEGANGSFAAGIEVNGSEAVIAGNYVKGGRLGITGSSTGSPTVSMDDQNIGGNILVEQTVYAIYLNPGASNHANRVNVHGNSIVAATALEGAIRLAGDCKYALISGNRITGPGSGSSGGRAVYLDSVNSDVSILGNQIEKWEQLVALYNAGAVAQTRIFFNGNDCSNDTGSDAAWIGVAGSATLGSHVTALWNAKTGGMGRNVIDLATLRIHEWSDSYADPEGNRTAGPGSLYTYFGGTQGPRLFVKARTSGDQSGWMPLFSGGRKVITYAASMTPDLTYGSDFEITATDGNGFTVANPTGGLARGGQRLTVRLRNTSGGALGTVTWDTLYKMASWTSPATGNSRSITFAWDGTNWIETSRTPSDVPN